MLHFDWGPILVAHIVSEKGDLQNVLQVWIDTRVASTPWRRSGGGGVESQWRADCDRWHQQTVVAIISVAETAVWSMHTVIVSSAELIVYSEKSKIPSAEMVVDDDLAAEAGSWTSCFHFY